MAYLQYGCCPTINKDILRHVHVWDLSYESSQILAVILAWLNMLNYFDEDALLIKISKISDFATV